MLKKLINIFHYRELIKTLVIRQIKVRYKKMLLGYLWTWLEPLATMFVLLFVVGILLRVRTEDFSIYLLTGLIPWTFFSNSLSNSPAALIGNAGLIKKVYFPREILPLSAILFNFFNLLLSLLLLIPIILLLKININYNVFLLPLFMLNLFMLTYGLALLFSCVNVYYRETEYFVRYMLQILFFLIPLFYSIERLLSPEYLNIYLILNPLAVIIMSLRGSLMGLPLPENVYILLSFIFSSLIFITGYLIFKKTENEVVKRI